MFGIGAGEMVVIAIVLLIAVGPARLPGLMRGFGKTVRQVKRMTHEFREASGIDELLAEADPNVPIRKPVAPIVPASQPSQSSQPSQPHQIRASDATPGLQRAPSDPPTHQVISPQLVEGVTMEVHATDLDYVEPTREIALPTQPKKGDPSP
jgi:Tat protein translocase TatB subunit